MFRFPRVTPERARLIVREVSDGSKAKGRFFVLLIVASMIAAFGLIANSTAVIIGAMLVSPLMTPIFGAALGMLRGNPTLLGWALWSELIGVILAIGAAYLVGLPQISFLVATPEMLARTHPNLLDLFVAIFAGFAGAYAMLDERVSPALPGVAIATAIVPPLSTCGLCLSLGAWSGAGGALLLFVANYVSILVVGLVTFAFGGLARRGAISKSRKAGHFGFTFVAFAVIAVVLTNSLFRITRSRMLDDAIQVEFSEQLALANGASLEELIQRKTPQGIQIFATVRARKSISPSWVAATESALETKIGEPVDLLVRTVLSQDITSPGVSLQVVRPNLDGVFLVPMSNDFSAREALATQVVLEFFESEPGFDLAGVEYGIGQRGNGVVVAYATMMRRLAHQEFLALEKELQVRFDDPSVQLFVSINAARLQGRNGPILIEWTDVQLASEDQQARLPQIQEAIERLFEESSDAKAHRIHFKWEDDHWRALVEVLGGESFGPADIQAAEEKLRDELGAKVDLLVRRRSDFIVTHDGYTDYESIVDPELIQRSEELRGLFRSNDADEKPDDSTKEE